MDIVIGSNRLRHTNGTFVSQDLDLIKVERHGDNGGLLLSMEIYNPVGTCVAKLERNAWASNERERFEIQTSPDSATLIDTTVKGIVFAVTADGEDGIRVSQAKFYLPGGAVSEVTTDRWHVGNTMELKDADVDMQGGAIEL